MKAIISHDVDHLTVWEHKDDFIVPKHLVRSCIELGLGHISVRQVLKRFENIIVSNKWNNLDALMKFDEAHGVPSTFFFGVANGMGLKYALKKASPWMALVKQGGFSIGVHGIAFEHLDEIRKEYDIFAHASGLSEFGIRMHYLRNNHDTTNHLANAGYIFDSSIQRMMGPYKVKGLWEFPVHIMDGQIMCVNASWQNQTLSQAKETTKALIDKVNKHGIEYLTIVSHDRYFCESFKTWYEWYVWLVDFLHEISVPVVSYHDAMNELNINRSENRRKISGCCCLNGIQ